MRAFVWIFAFATASVFADGGAILARQTLGGLDVTVFASPVPIRAGPVDVSVLVCDAATGQPALDAAVSLAWTTTSTDSPEWMPPCCTMGTSPQATATRSHSQNKLLYSAITPVTRSGPATLTVEVTALGRTASLAANVDVRPAAAPAAAYWPWLAFPAVAVAGFAVHQRLTRRENR